MIMNQECPEYRQAVQRIANYSQSQVDALREEAYQFAKARTDKDRKPFNGCSIVFIGEVPEWAPAFILTECHPIGVKKFARQWIIGRSSLRSSSGCYQWTMIRI